MLFLLDMKNVPSETYSLLIEQCTRDPADSIAAAVAAALHYSAQRGSDARPVTHFAPRGQTTATEEEVREVYDALKGQKRPPPEMRPALLSEVAGPRPSARGLSSLPSVGGWSRPRC